MKKLIVASMLGALLFVGYPFVVALITAQASFSPDLPGQYSVSGASLAGPYAATADIALHGRAVYVRWTFDGDVLYGVGIVDNDRLSVGYVVEGEPSVVVYRVVKDKPLTLEGQWTGYGLDRVLPETLVKR